MSWQLKTLNMLLRGVVRPRMKLVRAPQDARADFERMARRSFWAPAHLCHILGPEGLHRISCGPTRPRKIILYFHGGGYISGSPKSHEAMLGRLSGLSGVEVAAVRYPLAPEHPFPAGFTQACRAWAQVMALGYRPQDVVLGGDSAGGGLALAVLNYLCELGTPPVAAFALSPWCDLALTGNSLRRNADRDVLFPANRIAELVAAILPQGGDPRDPRLSPLYGRFADCPPVLLHYSEAEILQDDSVRMAKVLRAAGATVELNHHPTAPHVWHIFDGWVPEARVALTDVARFIRSYT